MKNILKKSYKSITLLLVILVFIIALVVPAKSVPVYYWGGVFGDGPYGPTCYCPVMWASSCFCGLIN